MLTYLVVFCGKFIGRRILRCLDSSTGYFTVRWIDSGVEASEANEWGSQMGASGGRRVSNQYYYLILLLLSLCRVCFMRILGIVSTKNGEIDKTRRPNLSIWFLNTYSVHLFSAHLINFWVSWESRPTYLDSHCLGWLPKTSIIYFI